MTTNNAANDAINNATRGPTLPPTVAAQGRAAFSRNAGASRSCVAALLLSVVFVLAATGCSPAGGSISTREDAVDVPAAAELGQAVKKLEKDLSEAEARNRRLLVKVNRFSPRGAYLIVDTGTNHLYLMDGERIVRDAVVSTGSGSRLVDVAGKRVWVFNTPRGEFEIQRKIVNPVWTKPDWAFIEEGEPIPRNFAERFDPDVLGDYAMAIGDGYLIHGSLYKRTLGMSVTHGCIRVGDDDLEVVYRAAQLGTRVYII